MLIFRAVIKAVFTLMMFAAAIKLADYMASIVAGTSSGTQLLVFGMFFVCFLVTITIIDFVFERVR